MQHHTLTWSQINEVADHLGASASARKKWRQRGVPPAWQVKIASHMIQLGRVVDPAEIDGVKPDRHASAQSSERAA